MRQPRRMFRFWRFGMGLMSNEGFGGHSERIAGVYGLDFDFDFERTSSQSRLSLQIGDS